MVFIDLQNFGKFRQKLTDFWPKNRLFFADSAKKMKPELRTKIAKSQNLLIRLLQFLFYVIFGIFRNFFVQGIFDFCLFLGFMGPQSCAVGHFLANIAKKCEKWPTAQLWGPIKTPKRQKSTIVLL